ncbi:MAG: hypothetical protein LBO66_05380 [Deltaproteobacteria bacterium]|jgi:hypothetical protein|nr:hypothetical protein [Deltaproteobacteria bacterium]
MLKILTFSFANLTLENSDFKDMLKEAEALVDKLALQETRFERVGQIHFLTWICASAITEKEMAFANEYFRETVPEPMVTILIALSKDNEQPLITTSIVKWLPFDGKVVSDKILKLYNETFNSFSTRKNGDRPSFNDIMSHVATPLREYVFSKIPQDLLE